MWQRGPDCNHHQHQIKLEKGYNTLNSYAPPKKGVGDNLRSKKSGSSQTLRAKRCVKGGNERINGGLVVVVV
jgi:hypothetical protein